MIKAYSDSIHSYTITSTPLHSITWFITALSYYWNTIQQRKQLVAPLTNCGEIQLIGAAAITRASYYATTALKHQHGQQMYWLKVNNLASRIILPTICRRLWAQWALIPLMPAACVNGLQFPPLKLSNTLYHPMEAPIMTAYRQTRLASSYLLYFQKRLQLWRQIFKSP